MDIETPRMHIRDFAPKDAADLYEILGDAETMEQCEMAYSFEKTKEFLMSFCIERKGAVAAVQKGNGKLVGYILFNEQGNDVYEMGWFFNRSVWRQGFAYESCKAVIDHAFEEGNAHKVFAETIDAVKSVSLMKKLGMELEGSQRSQTNDLHGNWADLYYYGILEDDWRKSKRRQNDALSYLKNNRSENIETTVFNA